MVLPAGRPRITLLVLGVVSVVLTLGLHVAVIDGSPVADDYMGFFPRTWADLAETWTGSWHPWPMDRYYRPLAAYAQAGLFELFGLHIRLLHAAAFVPVALLAWLVGVFLTIERDVRVAVAGMALLLGSPLIIEPLVVPPFFVFQSAGAIAWMLGLLWWQRERDRARPRWWPLVALTVVGALFKEDTFMLLPSVVLLQAMHTRGDARRATHWQRLAVYTGATGLVMVALRLTLFPAFEAMEAVEHPLFSSISAHVVPHLMGWFHPDLDERLWPSMVTVGLAAVAVTQWPRHPDAGRLIWVGAISAVCAYLPLATLESSHHSRAHLMALGSAMAGAGIVDLWRATLNPLPAAVKGALVAASALFWMIGPVTAAREHASYFRYCSEMQVLTDQVLPPDAPQISPDLRDWAFYRGETCASDTVQPVTKRPVLRWGVHPASDWVDDRVYALWSLATETATLQLQHPDATPTDVVDVHVTTATGTHVVRLDGGETASVAVTFSPGVRSTLRDGHVMTLTVSRRPGSTLRPGVRVTGWPPVPPLPPVIKSPE